MANYFSEAPESGETVLVEVREPASLPRIIKHYLKSNPQFVVYLGENSHGMWAQLHDARLKGQGLGSRETNELGAFCFLLPWSHVRTVLRVEKVPAQIRRKAHV